MIGMARVEFGVKTLLFITLHSIPRSTKETRDNCQSGEFEQSRTEHKDTRIESNGAQRNGMEWNGIETEKRMKQIVNPTDGEPSFYHY